MSAIIDSIISEDVNDEINAYTIHDYLGYGSLIDIVMTLEEDLPNFPYSKEELSVKAEELTEDDFSLDDLKGCDCHYNPEDEPKEDNMDYNMMGGGYLNYGYGY